MMWMLPMRAGDALTKCFQSIDKIDLLTLLQQRLREPAVLVWIHLGLGEITGHLLVLLIGLERLMNHTWADAVKPAVMQ